MHNKFEYKSLNQKMVAQWRASEFEFRGPRFNSRRVACDKTVRASEARGASEAGEVSQPVRAKQAGAGGPVQADRTVKVLNMHQPSKKNSVS